MLTYGDLTSELRDFLGTISDEGAGRSIKRAIRDAWEEFPSLHTWAYYWTIGRLNLQASYSTGTIAYTHSTRTVTLTSGTWPTYAADCVLVISQQVYRVATRTSNTVIILEPTLNPGADVASGTSYLLLQESVTLPADFRQGDQLLLPSQLTDITYVPPSKWQRTSRLSRMGGNPCCYTIMPSPDLPGRLAAVFDPYTTSALSIEYLYQRKPRMPRVEEISDGTATCTANSTTVTLSDHTLGLTAAVHNGCVLRISDDASRPTAPEGHYELDNPYAVELVIRDASLYASAWTVEVYEAPTTSLATKGFTISDPIDVGYDPVLTAFKRKCEENLATARNMKDAGMATGRAGKALLVAKESDPKVVDFDKLRSMGWRQTATNSMEIVP
jgi:hypothetical protein